MFNNNNNKETTMPKTDKYGIEIKVGDFVSIYDNKFTIDDFANLTDTIPYRIITCISKRYLRNYKY